MIPGKRYTPDDVLRAAWRRRWWIVVPACLLTIGAVVRALLATPRYRAEALIQVVPPAVSNLVSTPQEHMEPEQRLQSISRQIMTRPRLQAIIQELNLYERLRRVTVMEVVLDVMGRDTLFQPVGQDMFRIGYTADTPELALEVTNRLVALFLEESSRTQKGLAEAAKGFLEAELAEAERRLSDQEKKLEAYQIQYAGELPSQQAANLQVLNSSQQQLQTLAEALNRDRDQRLLLQRQLERTMSEELPVTGVGTVLGPEPGSAASELDKARADLRAMELRLLTPEHPDVIAVKATIARLEQKVALERSRGSGPTSAVSAVEAVRQSRIRELQAQIELLDRQIAGKQAEEGRIRATMAEYRRRLEATPMRESELTALTRDYDSLKKHYTELLDQQAKAKMAANLEQRQIGERFKVLDPARLPERRVSPKRMQMSLVGMAIGLLTGLLLGAVVELRDSSLRTDEDVEESIGLPVLATVPVVTSLDDGEPAVLRIAMICMGGAAVLTFAVTVLLKSR